MFLAERLISLGIYAYFLMIIFLLLYASNISVKGLLKCYTVILSVMAFCYKPYVTADLYRIYESLDVFSTFSFTQFYNELVVTASTPAARLYYFFIAKTGIPELLPAITCFIVYSVIFYIILETAKMFSINRRDIAIVVLFTMSVGNYMMVISNIRSMLAIALICYCFFRETVKRKYSILHIPLYIIAALMHNLGVILLALRIGILVFKKQKTSARRVVVISISAIATLLAFALFQSLIVEVMEKVYEYLTEDMYSYVWEYVIGIIVYGIEVWVLCCAKTLSEENQLKINDMKNYLTILLVVALVFCFEFSIFYRTVTLIAPVISIPIIMLILKERPVESYKYSDIRQRQTVLLFLSAALLFITCFRGSMTSLKFFIF